MKNRLTHVGVQLGQDLSDPVDVATENFGHQELLFEGEHHDRHLILHVETSTGQSEGAGGQTLDRGQIKTLGVSNRVSAVLAQGVDRAVAVSEDQNRLGTLAGAYQVDQVGVEPHEGGRVTGERIVLFDSSAADVVHNVTQLGAVAHYGVDALTVDRYRQDLIAVVRNLDPARSLLETIWNARIRRRLDHLQHTSCRLHSLLRPAYLKVVLAHQSAILEYVVCVLGIAISGMSAGKPDGGVGTVNFQNATRRNAPDIFNEDDVPQEPLLFVFPLFGSGVGTGDGHALLSL